MSEKFGGLSRLDSTRIVCRHVLSDRCSAMKPVLYTFKVTSAMLIESPVPCHFFPRVLVVRRPAARHAHAHRCVGALCQKARPAAPSDFSGSRRGGTGRGARRRRPACAVQHTTRVCLRSVCQAACVWGPNTNKIILESRGALEIRTLEFTHVIWAAAAPPLL